MHFLRQHRVVLAIFALALVVRFLYLGVSYYVDGGNLIQAISGADGYFIVSQNLIQGHGLSSDIAPPYMPYSFRPPIYHFFIFGSYFAFGGYWGVIIAQIVVGSMLAVLSYYLASCLTENKKVWAAVGVLMALEPSSILYSTMFYSEIVFMFWFFLSLLALFVYMRRAQRVYLFLSAELLGLATLTRPTTEFLPILLLGAVVWFNRKSLTKKVLIDVGGYVLLFLLVLAPWVYRNYQVFGTAEISPLAGVSLYTVLLPTVYSIERGTSFQQEYNTLHDQGVLGPNEAPVSVGGEYTRIAIPLLLAHPKALVISLANSGLNFFVQDGVFDFLRHIKIRPHEMLGKPATFAIISHPLNGIRYAERNIISAVGIILLGRVTWIVFTVTAIIGVWWSARRKLLTPPALLSVAIILYFALTSSITGFGLTSRYRMPVNPLILTFACIGISVVWPLILRRIRRHHA